MLHQFHHYCEVVGRRASTCGAFVTIVAIAAMLALSGSAEAQDGRAPPKTYTCNCACRAESGNEVNIANKIVYSNVPCSSISAQSCSVTVVTKEGSRTVSGRWSCS